MTGVTSGARPAYHSGAPEFTPVFSGVRVAHYLVFCVVFCQSLFVFCPFFSLAMLESLRRFSTSDWYLQTFLI